MVSNPIEKGLGERNVDEISGYFKKVESKIEFNNLSIYKLQELDNYDYIILFCKSTNNELYIEGDFFEEVKVTINDIIESIASINLKCIYIFADSYIEINDVDEDIPIVIIQQSQKLKNDIFKVFRRKDNKFLKSNCQFVNIAEDELHKFNAGQAEIKINKTRLPRQIDVKNLNSFIGRSDDLRSIIKEIIHTKTSCLIFTVKGSGGIGKTTVVKKATYELAKRGFFCDGIYFIDCEHIESIKHLEVEVSYCFNIDNSMNIEEHIASNELKKDNLIIFDNFEFLLNIDDNENIKAIKNLVKFLSDYSSILLISREVVFNNSCIEHVYELPDFSSDEAMELFKQDYKNLDEEEEQILREDILKNILYNNPLAIKIIKSNSPEHKSIAFLKKELEEDFFSSLSYNNIFNDVLEDEKSASLYNSINYSYQKLSEREKLALEFLFLFPDGINIKKFIEFSNGKFKLLTNIEIKMLEGKSLVEINSGNVKLLPIIRKFSKMKFQERSPQEKKRFYREAYIYNKYIIKIFREIHEENEKSGYNFLEKQSSNILEYINNLELLDITKEEKVLSINELKDTFVTIGRGIEYLNKIESLQLNLHKCDNNKLAVLFNMTKLLITYMSGDFDNSYNEFINLISFDEILKFNSNNSIDIGIIETSLIFYINSGHVKQVVMIADVFFDKSMRAWNIANLYLGKFNEIINNERKKMFFDFEYDFILNKINIEKLDSYIDNIYQKNYVELMQCNYIKVKMGNLCNDEIEKLVVTNPYTKGIKLLMKAILNDNSDSCKLYEDAIENLRHIKYYYTEAIYYYSKYLKGVNAENYEKWFELGYNNAKKYDFKYMIHLFICLRDDINIEYDENKEYKSLIL